MPKEQAPNLPGWEGDKIFLRLLAEDQPPFLLTLQYEQNRLVRAVLDGKNLKIAISPTGPRKACF